jgi:hypothetical protein
MSFDKVPAMAAAARNCAMLRNHTLKMIVLDRSHMIGAFVARPQPYGNATAPPLPTQRLICRRS